MSARSVGAKPCLDCGSMDHGRCVRPQERPVAGDGLDREAVRRLSESVNGFYHDDRQVDVTVAEAGAILLAREVPALLDALEAAEAEVARLRVALDEAQLRSIEARNPGIDMDEVRRLRTEGGAS